MPQPVPEVAPGDTVQYRASYRNGGTRPLANVVATVPVPAGTRYVPGSAQPAPGVLASADGTHFEPLPLVRRVRAEDGQWRDVPVPLEQYRALRWPARVLAPGETFAPSLRVRVNGAP